MDAGDDPYAPGAGTRPPLLAGRDDLVSNATIALARARTGRHGKSLVAVGLRGAGKTVVLNRVLELDEAENHSVAYIETHDGASLASLLVPRLKEIVLRIDRMEGAKALGSKALSTLKGFVNGFNVDTGDVEVSLTSTMTAREPTAATSRATSSNCPPCWDEPQPIARRRWRS